MMIRVVFFVFFVQIMFPGLGYGQGAFTRPGNVPTPQAPQTTSANNDNAEWNLPPLQVLIDHAIEHSPALKLADNEILMGEYLYKDVRRDWLQRFSILADARYGSMFDLSRIGSTTSSVPYLNSSALMMTYGVGLGFGTSVSDLFDRKRTKQKSKLTIEQAKIAKEESINTLTQTVITSYYNILSTQKTLAFNNEVFLMASIVHDKAKLDLAQNKISYAEYATELQAFLSAQNTVELQKYNLWRAVKILEIIVGIELIKTY